ncbi:hypothetical protein Mgra_00006066 [Meloidogyne graminicola]|uniref:Uncharacterized protein n=1 Tax=Meloidogyne graminicola TaxID=189291 RepID=A0A8S9ZMH8_9BILA|nr:hypothetical protein Mgra_00006066 [Meloidogyne graminicola]
MWWGSGYYGDGYGYGYYGQQYKIVLSDEMSSLFSSFLPPCYLLRRMILVIIVLIIGCLFLCCMLGIFWFLYSQKRNERAESANIQYYPSYYVPPAARIGKDGEYGGTTQFR